ncbi:MAG: LacI family DNA-binding transcriptional regulator, partial [Clostridiales bacterium]|nr:LacI family DNA-binding transcriptional regulator [Clostridiales bacterium]
MVDGREFNGNATIKHVARMAGVSISTVSRVINKKSGVSKDLEDKIKSAIDTLKYMPNTVARALKAKSTKSIGLIIPSIENPVFPPLVKVIE